MRIIEEIQKLNLSDEEYVVVGGGVMVAHGILEWDGDIDIAVTPEVYERLKQNGWHEEPGAWKGKPVIRHGLYDVGVGFGEWDLEELKADAVQIAGVPFMSLEKLRTWKQHIARPKDVKHVEMISTFLDRQDTPNPVQ